VGIRAEMRGPAVDRAHDRDHERRHGTRRHRAAIVRRGSSVPTLPSRSGQTLPGTFVLAPLAVPDGVCTFRAVTGRSLIRAIRYVRLTKGTEMERSIEVPRTFRGSAVAVGLLLLGAFVTYASGTALVNSVLAADDPASALATGEMALRVGALLMLADALFVAVIGVLLYAVGRGVGERVAIGYLATRIIEAVGLAVGVTFVLLPVTLGDHEFGDAATLTAVAGQGNAIAYRIAMIALGIGSVPFWYLASRAGLVPRSLAALGMAGYAIFFTGYALDILGFDVGLLLAIPGGLFEVALAIWLIARGFNSPSVTPIAARAESMALSQ
jgi:hypothetical protein